MAKTDSKVATKFIASPNYTPGSFKKYGVTIHYMVADVTAETCAGWFANPGRQASANYCVGSDGSCVQCVAEKDRSWCSANYTNDCNTITIEVANKSGGKPTAKALDTLERLLIDIAKRHGIKEWKYTGNAADKFNYSKSNMMRHDYFASTSCPGPWWKDNEKAFAARVNKAMNATTSKPTTGTSTAFKAYKVKVTADVLNVRKGAGTNTAIVTTVKKGEVYTIVGEKKSSDGMKWGKLKSGAGYISLKYTKKV